MERACKKIQCLVLSGKKTTWAGRLAGWLACWLTDLVDVTVFPPPSDVWCGLSRGLHGRQRTLRTTRRVVGHLAKAILRSVRSRDECFLRAREGEVQSLGPGLDLAARATQARPARGTQSASWLGCCMYTVVLWSSCGKREHRSAARPGRADSETADRGGRPNQSRCPPGLDTQGQASESAPLVEVGVAEDPRHLPDAV